MSRRVPSYVIWIATIGGFSTLAVGLTGYLMLEKAVKNAQAHYDHGIPPAQSGFAQWNMNRPTNRYLPHRPGGHFGEVFSFTESRTTEYKLARGDICRAELEREEQRPLHIRTMIGGAVMFLLGMSMVLYNRKQRDCENNKPAVDVRCT